MEENVVSPNPVQPVVVCPDCKFQILPEFFFCPNCGKVLRPRPLATTISKQINLYLVSFLLPPFGLWAAFKYLFQKDTKSKVVGVVAIILTGVSLALAAYYTLAITNEINKVVGPMMQGY